MKVFRQVVAEKGFSAGARKLGMSPASATRLIRDLEDHLGVRLLQRSTSRVALTAAGETYLDRVNAILADIDDAEQAVGREAREMSGRVRVLAEPGFASQLVAAAVAEFHWLNPKVQIELQVDCRTADGVEGHDITLIHDQRPLPAEAVARPLVPSRSILCASPAYLRRHGEPRTPADLQRHAFIHALPFQPSAHSLRLLHEDDGERAEETVAIVPALICNDPEAALRSTLEGAGIGAVCAQTAAPLQRSGRLQRVLPDWLAGRATLMAVFPSRRHMPARTRAFLDHLVVHAARHEMAFNPANDRAVLSCA
jgi:DNA-binding transcriptional LysR family regulator